ncbi:MAG: membrane assembly protein AsmA [Bacteroidetes bacterium]|nr:membrane assembly protein AsmA [Bacteroidota bacterium]
MKKVLKWFFIVVIILLVVIISLPFMFKGKIIAEVKKQANENLNAKVDFGDIDLTLLSSFPYFGLAIDNLSIVGVNDFEGDTLISSKQISVSLNLMSVIKGEEYSIRSIKLVEPHIFAKVLKDGRANWDIAKPSTDTMKAAEPEAATKFKMKLKSFVINDANIIYDDKSLDFYTALVGMNHELSGDFTQDDFLLKTLTEIKQFTMGYGGVNYLSKAKTVIKMDLDANMPNFKFVFKDNKIDLNELSFQFDGFFAMPKEDMEMDLTFKALQSEFKSFLSLIPSAYSADFANIKTAGSLGFDGFVKGIYNEKKMPAFALNLVVKDAMFKYPSLPKSVNNIQLDVHVNNKTGDPDNTLIDINKFHAEMAGNPVDVLMHIATPVSDPNINGSIKGKVDLASVRDFMPTDGSEMQGQIAADLDLKGKMSSIEKEKYEEFNAKGTLEVANVTYKSKDTPYDLSVKKMVLAFSPQFVDLKEMSGMLGKSDFQANGKIDNFLQYYFKNELLKGHFNFNSTFFDVNQFMADDASTASATPAAADTAPMSVVEVPANIDFVLNSSISKLLYDNLVITNTKGEIVIRNQQVQMNGVSLHTLGGEMTMRGIYNTQNVKNPTIDFDLGISNFDIPSTYKAFVTVQKLAPVAQYTKGNFSTQLKLKSVLDKTMMPKYETMAGGGKLQTKAITVSGFEPLNKLADALKMEKYKKMDLQNLDITYSFKDGRINVEPFEMKTGNTKGIVQGYNSFDQTINYTMDLEIPRSEFGSQANAAVNSLLAQANSKGANLSVGETVSLKALIGGTILKPTISTSLKDAKNKAVDDLKEKAKEEFDKQKKELEDKARAEADKLKKEAEEKAKAEADRLKKEAEAKAKAEADKLKKQAEEKGKDAIKDLFKKPK